MAKPTLQPMTLATTKTRKNRKANAYLWTGGIMIAIVALCSLLAPLLSSLNPNAMDPIHHLLPIGTPGHILGTDQLGRDMYTRLLYGGRVTVVAGLAASLLSTSVGVLLGLTAGYTKGWLDTLIMRSLDVLMGFPFILLAILIVAFAGPSTLHALLAISVANLPFFARIIRSETLKIRSLDFIRAAESLGASHLRIVFRHIAPSLMPYILSTFFMNVGWMITQTSSLSFLGLGTQPPTADWGSMLAEAQNYMSLNPLVAMLPGLAIVFAVVGFNLFGVGLKRYLDIHNPR